MLRTNINSLDIAYQRVGNGPPLVLLHGILGDSRDWRPQIEELSRDFAVIAWDAPGCGGSSDPVEPFGSADYVNSLAQFIQTLDAYPAHIAGLSWGGALALALYRQHPELFRSMVLADTYPGWKGSFPDEVVRERLEMCLRESEMAPEDFVPGWLPGLVTDAAPDSLRREIVEIMSSFHPAGYRLMVQAFAHLDLRDVLPTISVPTLLIWGAEDKRSPVNVGETMRDSIPGARLVVIPQAGHTSNAEQPERFNTAVREFCLSSVK